MAGGVDFQGATGASYTLTEDEEGKAISVRVSFTDDAGNAEELTSPATEAVQPLPSPATVQPAITGTSRVGETLTADTSGISDADGMENVSFTYQWTAGGTDVPGAAGASYNLTKDEEGKAISVRVSLAGDRDNAEELTSAPTAPVEPEPDEPEPTEPAESPPSAPRNLSISAAGTGTLALSWVEPSDPGSPGPVRYIVQWKECCWSRRRNKMAANPPIADMSSRRRACE